jgi:hypothetical protein
MLYRLLSTWTHMVIPQRAMRLQPAVPRQEVGVEVLTAVVTHLAASRLLQAEQLIAQSAWKPFNSATLCAP